MVGAHWKDSLARQSVTVAENSLNLDLLFSKYRVVLADSLTPSYSGPSPLTHLTVQQQPGLILK
jgi:hypothetical protein